MAKKLIHFELISYVYEAEATHRLQPIAWDQKTDELIEAVDFSNRIIFFPEYEVAMSESKIFYASDWNNNDELVYFAPSVDKITLFIDSVNDKLRSVLMKQVSYMVDTDDGVKRSNIGASDLITREDVFLEPTLKRDIFRSIDEFFKKDSNFFEFYGLPYKRGILLYGAPGNGKTTLVKSITGTVDAPVVYWQITEHTDSDSIQEVFRLVNSLAPAVLVIEDLDSMPEYARSIFLNTLDGSQSRNGIFIIGTTNYPERIDSALINRAGRFDRAYEVKAPKKDMRYDYLVRLDQQKIFNEDILTIIAKKTRNLSVSQLNELYMSVALNWHYDGELRYEEVIEDLQKQRKHAEKKDWEDEDSSIGF
ncbi:ATP-binding protein [Kurthia sibirica]|nr:ATP-binding protein [Kurthia sibirica]GEK33897.1 putative ATPase YjoB [Kurthia sibirica]